MAAVDLRLKRNAPGASARSRTNVMDQPSGICATGGNVEEDLRSIRPLYQHIPDLSAGVAKLPDASMNVVTSASESGCVQDKSVPPGEY